MAAKGEGIRPQWPQKSRAQRTLDLYLIALSVVMMLFGLRHWAVIIGLMQGTAGAFPDVRLAWKVAIMHFAVVDLVAAVGLWMRVAWGQVIWVYAALAEVAMFTLFARIFGLNWPVVGFHLATLVVFLALTIWARRSVSV